MNGLIRSFKVDSLQVHVFSSMADMAEAVSQQVHGYLLGVLAAQPSAAAILATGNSQIRFLERLVSLGGVDASRLTLFHMDEYLGLPADHKASFRRYMKERVEEKLKPRKFNYIDGDCLLPIEECERYEGLLKAQPIDLCCMGIGENGHIAFNDPPVANFEDTRLVKLVKLDDACKMQQVKEGHFSGLDTVPPYAITLTIPALVGVRKVVCVAPEKRKADAVKAALEGPISTACPASALRRQPHATLFLDQDSAALLSR